jgi:beta-N-acetylhexosaminidase
MVPGKVATPWSCSLGTRLAGWTVARLAAETIVVPVDEGDVSAVDGQIAEGVGGVLLVGEDATSSLARSITALRGHAPGGIAPFVMVDEEGGAVQRLANLVGTLPSARGMGATLTPPAIEALGRREGARLKALGVTVDLAPVLDLDAGAGPNTRDSDGTRSFSINPSTTTADALAFADGLRSQGILPVFKHFPGLGGATGNTDLGPASTVPYAALQRAGLLPFRAAIAHGATAIMVSNASVPGLSPFPSSLSRTVITTVLRHDLGFDGLVVTDSLSVPSVTPAGGSLTASVVSAIEAGADIVLFNAFASQVPKETSALVAGISAALARGTISRNRLETAVGRILLAKDALPPCGA